MILRSLRVEQFRRHNLPIDIPFNERFTVISGPNEAGKSTLFQALQYGFFRRSGATGKDIDRIMPWDAPGLAPTIVVEFEHAGSEYRLTKSWGKQAASQIAKRNAAGTFEPSKGTETDEFLANLFAGAPLRAGGFPGFTGQQLGLAYLLFVPQGAIKIEGDANAIALNEDATARLTSIVGAAVQSAEEAQIAKKIECAYGVHFTPSGKQKKHAPGAASLGALKDLERRIDEATLALEAFTAAAQQLESAEVLSDAAAVNADCSRERAEQGRPRFQQAVELKGSLELAERAHGVADLHYSGLLDRDRRLQDAKRTLQELEPRRVQLAHDLEIAGAGHAVANAERCAATEAFRRANATDPGFQALREELACGQQAAGRRRELELLGDRLSRASALFDELATVDAQILSAGSAKQADCEKLRGMVEAQRDLRARIAAAMTTLELTAERDVFLEWKDDGDQSRTLPAGQAFELSRAGELSLRIAGVGRIRVRGPVADLSETQAQLVACDAKLAALEKALGTNDPVTLQRRVDTLRGLTAERARLQSEQSVVLAGATLGALKQLVDDGRAELRAAPDAARVTQLEALVAEQDAARRRVLDAAMQTTQAADERESESARAHVSARTANESFIAGEWRRLETELASLNRDVESDEQRVAALRASYAARYEAERALEAARTAYEPFRTQEDPAAELTRLENEKDKDARAAQEAAALVRALHQRLAEGREKAPAVLLMELEEKAAGVRAQAADEKLTEDALVELHRFVDEAQQRRVDDFAKPVLDRVAPWFSAITGNELRGLDLSKHQELSTVQIAGVSQEIDLRELSYGTGDQLALLIRLAFASLLTAPSRLGRMPVLLDDPLVNADRRRRGRFCTVLEEVAASAQVVVFTCRPEDYQGTSASFVTIGATEATEPPSAPDADKRVGEWPYALVAHD